MKKYLVFISIGLLLACQQKPSEETSREEIEQALAQFSQAFLQADDVALSNMLTDNYMHSNSGSEIIRKDSWLNYIKSRKAELESGKLDISKYENEEVFIEIYGTAAVVNGLNLAEGVRDSIPFQSKIRFTHLWVREGGHWKRAAFHDSKLN